MRKALLAFVAVLLCAGPVCAQRDSLPLAQVPLQSRVRVDPEGGERVTGRLLRTDSGRVVVNTGAAAAAPFSVAALESMSVSRGRQRGLWTATGFFVGGAAGILYSRAQEQEPEDIGGVQGVADGIANTILGALIGGIAGFVLAPERWRAVALRQ
ncbi:MAG TPA: hypothetical protein VF665_16635 [Longimicrobium sp.]|uniref:hypothetical protein n=1 Tax=Longimicrobium sp. TaxID=2029185 RepID=UPI002EDAFF0F